MLPSPQPTSTPFAAGYASITFDPGNASMQWTGEVSYQTSGGVPTLGVISSLANFTSNAAPYTIGIGTPIPGSSPTPNATNAVEGGRVPLTATYTASASNDPVTDPAIQGWITGIPSDIDYPGGIDYASINNELCSIYTSENGETPATLGLFTLIAWDESSYQQFVNLKANGRKGRWPNECKTCKHKGEYIGLLQVALTNNYFAPMDTAWNWLVNSQVSYDIFNQKIGFVINNIQTPEIKTHSGLQALTQLQLENMALLQYGGVAGPKNPKTQYYTVQCVGGTGNSCSGGAWQWLNNKKYKGITTYVEKVRNPQPTGNPTSATCN